MPCSRYVRTASICTSGVHVRDATVFGEINCVFIFISVDVMLTPKMNWIV